MGIQLSKQEYQDLKQCIKEWILRLGLKPGNGKNPFDLEIHKTPPNGQEVALHSVWKQK